MTSITPNIDKVLYRIYEVMNEPMANEYEPITYTHMYAALEAIKADIESNQQHNFVTKTLDMGDWKKEKTYCTHCGIEALSKEK